MDLFADRLNTQLRVFASWKPDPLAKETDTFSFTSDVCISPVLSGKQMPREVDQGQGGVGVNNANMAHSDVVSQVIGDVGGGTDPVTGHGRPAEVASGAGSPFDSGRQAPTSSVADQWQGRQGAVLSEQATKIMEEARRQGTRKAYRHPWEEWVGWCEFRQEDPVQAPVELVANFLTQKFHTGLAYRTMNVYRSAISAKHSLVQGLLVGQNMLIVKLLKGMFNEKPPQPKYMETWDAATVLERMKTQPEDEFLSLRDLSLKVCMLMALTSASRASELHKLKISMMLDKGDEMEFHIGELTKGRKVGDGPLVIRFVQYEAEPKLNVVHCLRTYLDTTEELRAAGTAGEQLLISFKQPHGALAKSSVARWLKIAMQEAGIDTSVFQAHSTRAAATSRAENLGLSVQQIMERANWKRAMTFKRYYHKEVKCSFQDKVLSGR